MFIERMFRLVCWFVGFLGLRGFLGCWNEPSKFEASHYLNRFNTKMDGLKQDTKTILSKN